MGSKSSIQAFFNPPNVGNFTLASSQVGKMVSFTSIEGVFVPEPVVRIYTGDRRSSGRKLVKQYSLNQGIRLTGNNSQGFSKTLELTLQGSLVNGLKYGDTLYGECEFFGEGDVDATFGVITR